MNDDRYPRDLTGFGESPPDPQWPGGARMAMSFVLNWEEGGELSILHGDETSESFEDSIGVKPWVGQRHPNAESMFEYGGRAGVWRLARLFDRYEIPVTVFAVGMAVERSPGVVRRLAALGHEICSHGYRWINYQKVDEATEREHIGRAIRAIEDAVGERPLGWYTGRCGPNTRRLVVEEGGFLYDSDSYADDLPYWTIVDENAHLIVPYALDANDMRFDNPAGFGSGDDFYSYLKDSFDVLYEEGAVNPKMMSVGVHARIAGRPGRTAALARFVDYASAHEGVWFARRVDIARHWIEMHPSNA